MISSLALALLLGASRPPVATAPGYRAAPSHHALTAGPTGQEHALRVAAANIARWRNDPVAFVREQFGAEPHAWQLKALNHVACSPKVAMSACKGPGKSCLLAWVVWWFLATHYDAQIMCVSITEANLKDNLWKELAVWREKSPLLKEAYRFGRKRIENKERPATWWVSARAFAQNADPSQQANTLAGFHGKNIMVVLDELGDYPPGVLPAAEAIFANKDPGGAKRLVCAGNPTRTDGPLYQIHSQSEGWEVVYITGDPDDPERSPNIDIEWARAEIRKWGRDNPWVMVNILGQFPPGSPDQLIALTAVVAAMHRDLPSRAWLDDPIIWGIDPARFGDDEITLVKRQGLLVRPVKVWRNLNGTQLGDAIAKAIIDAEEKGKGPDAVFIDVGSVGTSPYDRLVFLGYENLVQPVDFGSDADDIERYGNKRAEMWANMAKFVQRNPAMLPNDPTLKSELTAPTYYFGVKRKRTVLFIESKEDMKSRGVPSPNRADGLCLTFAGPVAPRELHARTAEQHQQTRVLTEYDPYARA